jgi:hypothetical protein
MTSTGQVLDFQKKSIASLMFQILRDALLDDGLPAWQKSVLKELLISLAIDQPWTSVLLFTSLSNLYLKNNGHLPLHWFYGKQTYI